MLTLGIICILAVNFYIGFRRGLMLQLIYTGGYLLTFLAAKFFYRSLAAHLELLIPYPSPQMDSSLVLFDQSLLFDLDKSFYAAAAFIIILVIGWLVTKLFGVLSYGVTFIPILRTGNALAGGVLNAAVMVIVLSVLLTAVAMIPVDVIQQQFKNSLLARLMVEHTPIISHLLKTWWITDIIS
ncbi:CvpA family protein [Vagococcus acidifermentans]|uniref:Colicin V production protein CvpA n=1 Tax=Vagococcus acidifermentans TaxID=564710 RepID=A0A430AMA1_9ENTE|nr:CvpA family protein [Vagococcus acidifermentans]RSU09034.1 colicin V production protein CvpA [Vagococcus acidifermentans]